MKIGHDLAARIEMWQVVVVGSCGVGSFSGYGMMNQRLLDAGKIRWIWAECTVYAGLRAGWVAKNRLYLAVSMRIMVVGYDL